MDSVHRTIRMALPFLTAWLLMAGTVQAQTPWPQSKGGFYLQAACHFIPTYNALYSEPSWLDPLPHREMSEATFELYGEYGLTARTTAVMSLPLRQVSAGRALVAQPLNQAGRLTGLGNVALSLRHRFGSGRRPFTGTLRLELPATAYDNRAGLRTGYPTASITPLLSTGEGFRRAYWFAYGGVGLRGKDYSPFVLSGAEGGARLGPVWLIVFSEWKHSLETGSPHIPLENHATGLFVDRQAYLSVGGKVLVSVGRFWGLVGSAAGALYAQNLPKSPGLGLGVYFKWE
jgi:hypothetical protein